MSEFTVHLIVLLLPGVVSALLVERLTIHPPWSHFRFILYSVLLGASSYGLLDIAYRIAGVTFLESETKLHAWAAVMSPKADVPSNEVVVACAIGAILGFIITRSIQAKWLHRFARMLHISNKYGDENLFSYFLGSPETEWVFISDQRVGLTYEGRLQSFSEEVDVREILLTEVRVYEYDTSDFLYGLKLLYLSFEPGALTIEAYPEREDSVDGKAEKGNIE